MKRSLFLLCMLSSCTTATKSQDPVPGEDAFEAVRQITFDGFNTQANWSFDDRRLIFQRKENAECDSVFTLDIRNPLSLAPLAPLKINSSFQISPSFMPTGDRVLLSRASTETECKDQSVSQIILSKKDGSDWIPAEPAAPRGYQAEVDVCKNQKVVFTSDRDGERTLFLGDIDATFGTFSNVAPIAHLTGKNEHAHFSPDCTKLVWQHLSGNRHEIWMGNTDGTHARKITKTDAATSSVFTPDGHHVVFAMKGSLYQIRLDGGGLKRLTFSGGEEKDPMFSHDGKKIVFSSSRGGKNPGDLNLFIADWKMLVDEGAGGDPDLVKADAKNADVKSTKPVKKILPEKSGYLGAVIERSGNQSSLGVKVKAVAADSPAAKAGMLKADRIVGVIGTKAFSILNAEGFDEAIKELKPGEKIKIQIRRGAQLKMIELETTLSQKH